MTFLEKTENVIRTFLDKKSNKQKIIVLAGPTASGKTALSLQLSNIYGGEVISADSRQVYRGMDIGTDKIPCEKIALKNEQSHNGEDDKTTSVAPEFGLFHQGVRHHMIDEVNPDERFTVAAFIEKSHRYISEIAGRKKIPIIAGGTGLYIRALTENFSIPSENPGIRKRLYDELATHGAQALHEKLQKVDPESAAKIHYNNHPYVVRALEIFELTGTPKSQLKSDCAYDVLKIGLRWPKEIMFERINKRAHEQLYKNGLIEETKSLLAQGYAPTLASMSSLGYREVIAYLTQKLTLEQCTELLQQNTRNYGKRQLTWFNKEPNLIWIEGV